MTWPMRKLETLASDEQYAFVGGPFGSKLTSRDYVDSGVPVIRGTNLSNGRFLGNDGFVYVTEEKVRKDLSSNLAKADDLIFTQRGTLGQVAIVPNPGIADRYVVSQSQMKLTVDESKAHRIFLYYYFSSRMASERINNLVSSSGVPHINLTVLRNFEVPVPPVNAQKSIAAVLSAYDDLIENNRRRIQLLEQSARLLYKEWFVRLRFPGHEHAKFVDGVPEGWERKSLAECSDFLSGGTPSKKRPEFWEGSIPWVSSGELTCLRVHRTKLNVTEEGLANGTRLVPPETILAVVRGMSLAKEFRLGITARPVSFNQDIKAISARPGVDALLLFQSLEAQRDSIRDRAGDSSHGTKKLDTPVLSAVPILIPTRTIQTLFRQYVASLHAQWDNLDQQTQALKKARNLLLPRLMNGEVTI